MTVDDRPLDVRTIVAKLLTNTDLSRLFRKTELTILNWRKNEGLPFIPVPGTGRDTIRYDRDEVIAWAKDHGKRIFLTDQE